MDLLKRVVGIGCFNAFRAGETMSARAPRLTGRRLNKALGSARDCESGACAGALNQAHRLEGSLRRPRSNCQMLGICKKDVQAATLSS